MLTATGLSESQPSTDIKGLHPWERDDFWLNFSDCCFVDRKLQNLTGVLKHKVIQFYLNLFSFYELILWYSLPHQYEIIGRN